MKTRIKLTGFVSACIFCISSFAAGVDLQQKPASPATIQAQKAALASLPKDDGRDEDFVTRGFIATVENPVLKADDGTVVFDTSAFDWMKGEAPDTINPSLWRHMKLLKQHGLYKVTDGVWQIRNLDIANMTIVRGDTGWIVIDSMMTRETAAQAMSLVNKYLGKRPVSAVMYSHSHVDHFGGVRSVVEPDSSIPIIAPEHFLQEAVDEFVMIGNIVARRAAFQSGKSLAAGPKGFFGVGILTTTPDGTLTLLPPTDSIRKTGETRVIDGVKFEFQMVPETEAPAEMNFYLPQHRLLYISEITSCTLHNLQTPRGAKVRDALSWAGYLTEALTLYGDRSDILTTGHCWPRFGNAEVKKHIRLQRDNYKYIHDQTVRLANNGLTPNEIADQLQPPKGIANEWSTHGYYGTYRQNVKGVYQYYIGWWDGIPAHLNLHSPVEQGKRYLRAMGEENMIKEAKRAMTEGDYRWSAELLNHLVFAEPENAQAKALLADSYEQMGYQAESAIWRNFYLRGAEELRHGIEPWLGFLKGTDLPASMETSMLMELIATRLNPATVADKSIELAIEVTDTKENLLLTLENSVLVHEFDKTVNSPDVTLKTTRGLLQQLFLTRTPLADLKNQGLEVAGNMKSLETLRSALEAPKMNYPIVTP